MSCHEDAIEDRVDPARIPPLNIWSRSEEEIGRLMSHFAHAPFVLDGVAFGSVEAFYAWLVCPPSRRAKVAPLWGARAKHECPKTPPRAFNYRGRMIDFESTEHHDLILKANRAKLDAHPEIARAFVATLPRPIIHELPGKNDVHDVFCGIMNSLRDECATKLAVKPVESASPGSTPAHHSAACLGMSGARAKAASEACGS